MAENHPSDGEKKRDDGDGDGDGSNSYETPKPTLTADDQTMGQQSNEEARQGHRARTSAPSSQARTVPETSMVRTEDTGTTHDSRQEQKQQEQWQEKHGERERGGGGGGGGKDGEVDKDEQRHTGPLDKVLQIKPPGREGTPGNPLRPPPYVHHFDSYSLVKQLQEEGYTTGQAIVAMKGIRGLLEHNLAIAQDSLHSKSDVENETYLFSAACSELRQEIMNNRRLQDEQTRQQRTLLQHEVDILTQSLNQEVLSLNHRIRGMFDDRRMAVREEQKTADSSIQQINYKISTSLVSDSKSEIEGVRWILIRRSALGIFFMAMVTLGTIRYASYLMNEKKEDDRRRREKEEQLRRDGGKRHHNSAADAAAILSAN
ncbi:Protein of unknown function (DUF1640) [Geosmithia morbida]|uniref:MOZ protein represents a chromatin-associated acetyltransferase n=1 Tax=Geosmithia morbida TaxID=1094350 RepID=A0A9P4YSZ8_9HYPO|nr:Protein of unknown function (DUF1640) [Geosmithia morbida]KAF4121168.1 Protein of unknown function (DUF1640) [Geosmithia morbida]